MLPIKSSPSFANNSTLKHRRQQLFLQKTKRFVKYLLPILFLIIIAILYQPISQFISSHTPSPTKKTIISNPTIPINLFFTNLYPRLVPESTTSAQIISAIDELDTFVSTQTSQLSQINEFGQISTGSVSATISLIVTSKPDEEVLQSAYKIINLLPYYLQYDRGYLYHTSFFLRATNLPDMIISVAMPKEEVEERLKYLQSLLEAKANPKLIDLRFKHPLIY